MRDSDRNAKIIDLAQEAIVSVDCDFNIVLFNLGAESIFGYRRDEIMGQPLDVLLPRRFQAVHRQHIKDFDAENVEARKMNERGQITGVRKNGEEFPAIASILKTGRGADTNFTVILRDITAIEKIRSELHRRIRQLESDNLDYKLEKQQLARTDQLLDELIRQSKASAQSN